MAREYNLMQYHFTNSTFAVVLDLYTPRPHFIILPKGGTTYVKPEFSHLTDEQKNHLIDTAKYALECFRIDAGILSIHFGKWRSKSYKFHAHICVHADDYLRIFEIANEMKAIPHWPSEYYTRRWKFNNPFSYELNVRSYPYHNLFFSENLPKVEILNKSSRVPNCQLPVLKGFKTVFHPSHPKIGFLGTKPKSIQEYQQALSQMHNFAEKLGLTESNENDGCHVCLYLGSGMYLYFGILYAG